MNDDPDDVRGRDERAASAGQTAISIVVMVAAAMLVLAGGTVGLMMGMHAYGGSARGMPVGQVTAPASDAPAASVFTLAGLSPEIAGHYHFAHDHPMPYKAVPCYCGCEATLDHQNLFRCFVTDTGAWEVHASGCVVCEEESAMVRAMLARGAGVQQIHDAIVARFGALTGATS
ncbi:MAG: PCYCGC motif-containing (lipo)protein [Planctomycetaceae bacterium]